MSSVLNNLLSKIHFIGIGGIGMSGIAEIMHNLGYKISGSDISKNQNIERLEALGIKVQIGHREENITNIDYVVISSAIKHDNPEVIAAIENKIPVIRRAEMLAELMRFKGTGIAISGSHGKTTTTALMACMLESLGLDPSVINGGIINKKSTNAYIGDSEYIVAEADESDGTFTRLPATIAVITNIDIEHMDYYKDFENLLSYFKKFITNLPFYGFAIACIDNDTTRKLISQIVERKVITYGIDSQDANVRAYHIRQNHFSSTFNVSIEIPRKLQMDIKDITLPTPGIHNILNALPCISVAAMLDFKERDIQNSLTNFEGVKRRFTKICEYNEALVIDDYAHHPEEIKATLEAAKQIVRETGGKIRAIFQPHRYSRLKDLFEEFTNCFFGVSELYIMEVYPAGEKPISGFESKDLITEILQKNKNLTVSSLSTIEAAQKVAHNLSKGDIMLFMGAGNITHMANDLGKILERKSKIVA